MRSKLKFGDVVYVSNVQDQVGRWWWSSGDVNEDAVYGPFATAQEAEEHAEAMLADFICEFIDPGVKWDVRVYVRVMEH
jgi:hypothetical protein